ncbi:MAG TPA: hypothetical protein VLK33_07795, partial [Terriglobales bacterium]|nr:hypothetical protein [Terriglobales bacterium]
MSHRHRNRTLRKYLFLACDLRQSNAGVVSLIKMEVDTMFTVWPVLMALGVSVIAIFMVLRIGSFSGRWSTRRDRLFVAAMTLFGTIIFSTILWWLGLLLLGENGALILSFVGDRELGRIAVDKRHRAVTGLANFSEYWGDAVACNAVPRSRA